MKQIAKDDVGILSYSNENFIGLNSYQEQYQKFTSSIAHEIKNPLALIKSMLQIVEKQVPSVKNTKYWTPIFGEIQYLNDFLTDLYYLNNINSIDKKILDIIPLIKSLKQSYDAYAKEQNKNFAVTYSNALPNIIGNNIQIKQALINLIKNAFEATQEDDHIYVNAFCNTKWLVIEVKDTGYGMTQEQMNNIFKPFVTHKKTGTGLGLSITQKIVSSHNGTIEVKSVKNKGTTFTIKFPYVHEVTEPVAN